jgi:hypothetical protein
VVLYVYMYFGCSTYSQLLATTGGLPAEPNMAEIYYRLQLVYSYNINVYNIETKLLKYRVPSLAWFIRGK